MNEIDWMRVGAAVVFVVAILGYMKFLLWLSKPRMDDEDEHGHF